MEEWCSSHDEPVEPPLSDLQELDFQDQFLSWIQPEVGAENHGCPVEGVNEAGTGDMEVEDGWCPSFPVSVHLANQVEISQPSSGSTGGRSRNERSFRLGGSDSASSSQLAPQPEHQVAVPRNAEEIQPALSPPPRKPTRRPRGTRAFRCPEDLCATTFISKRDLERHVNGVHHKLFTRCPHCFKQLKARSDNVKRHVDKFCRASKRQSPRSTTPAT